MKEYVQRYYLANSEHLRNDPFPRDCSIILFEAKGYQPRHPGYSYIVKKEIVC